MKEILTLIVAVIMIIAFIATILILGMATYQAVHGFYSALIMAVLTILSALAALSLYEGLTILRITDVVGNDVARREFEETTRTAACSLSLSSLFSLVKNSTSTEIVPWQSNPLFVLFEAARRRVAAASFSTRVF